MTKAPKTPQQTVARRVRELRETRGISQRSLAERMERLGHNWAISSVSRVEAGKRDVSIDELFSLALAFGEKPTALLDTGSDSVAVGGHVIPAQLFKDWMYRDKYSLGLTPDGLGLTQILEDPREFFGDAARYVGDEE